MTHPRPYPTVLSPTNWVSHILEGLQEWTKEDMMVTKKWPILGHILHRRCCILQTEVAISYILKKSYPTYWGGRVLQYWGVHILQHWWCRTSTPGGTEQTGVSRHHQWPHTPLTNDQQYAQINTFYGLHIINRTFVKSTKAISHLFSTGKPKNTNF